MRQADAAVQLAGNASLERQRQAETSGYLVSQPSGIRVPGPGIDFASKHNVISNWGKHPVTISGLHAYMNTYVQPYMCV